MAGTPDPYAAFRPNLEQQRKRAKELLRALRADDRSARERIAKVIDGVGAGERAFKLADAQFVIARELGFASWRELRTHIAALDAARSAIRKNGAALDRTPRTLHLRCGSDIQHELVNAGFAGGFLSVWDPFTVGPVTAADDWIEQRARFHADGSGGGDFEMFLEELSAADVRLRASSREYDRVVIWMEHDSHDQLALIRCLAQYARTGPPPLLELISVNHFPGSSRFIGLGQLPPEAMRLLWRRREAVGPSHLQLADESWRALTSADPRDLAGLMRTGTPALPHLAPALHRHLQELPSRANGLGLTQWLTLQMVGEQPSTIGRLFRTLHAEREPLPFLGDTEFLRIVREMGRAAVPVFERTEVEPGQPFRDQLTITDEGRAVLRGARDWLSMQPPPRWIGGVHVRAGDPAWRWDEAQRDVCTSAA